MDFQSRVNDESNQTPKKNIQNKESHQMRKDEGKPLTGPAVVIFWMWNWLLNLPKTVTNLYADLKSGEFLARFTLVDAMLQFLVAVATSCHPQEEPNGDTDEYKANDSQSSKGKKDIKVFGGTGRALRSRVIETQS